MVHPTPVSSTPESFVTGESQSVGRHRIGPSSIWTIAGLLVVSEVIYVKLVRFNAVSTTDSVVTFMVLITILFLLYGAAYLVLRNYRASPAKPLTLVLVGAILFRLTLLLVGLPPNTTPEEKMSRLRADVRSQAVTYDSYLLFDNDIWRYLWDGHVSANGLNPYRLAPRSPGLDYLANPSDGSALWADIRANVNHPDVPTIYPPFAQLIFRMGHAVAPGSVLIMKLLLVSWDLLTVLIVVLALRVMHRPVTDVVLYAWNPLVIKAIAGSGHVDAVLAALLVATVYFVLRGSRSLAAVAWGLSILVKISPIILLPFLIRRIGWKRSGLGIAVVIIGYAPYFDAKTNPFMGLLTFASEWQFNSGFFSLIEWLASPLNSDPVVLAKVAATLTLLAVMIWLIRLDDGAGQTFPLYCVSALGVMLVLGPTVMPWYLIWIVPLALVARTSAWIQFSALVCLAFLTVIDGRDRAWVLLAEYGILAVLLWREQARGKQLKNAQAYMTSPKLTAFTQSATGSFPGGTA
jgi:hypothetical protein